MSNKYKFRNTEGKYFVTFSVINWIDVFTRNMYREILLESLVYCQNNKGLIIHGYVIMTNHVHMIISSKKALLENIMRDLKKFTSVEVIKAIANNDVESRREWMLEAFRNAGEKNSNNTHYQFWQQDNHPIEIRSQRMFIQQLNYIHYNPVVHGFVTKEEDYPWSSMMNLMYGMGINGISIV